MEQLGKTLAVIGLSLAGLGGLLYLLGKAGFRGLPGDIRYESEHVRVYFPIASSIAISVILTLGMWLWSLLGRK